MSFPPPPAYEPASPTSRPEVDLDGEFTLVSNRVIDSNQFQNIKLLCMN